MKKLILFLSLLMPVWALAQQSGTMQLTSLDSVRATFGPSGIKNMLTRQQTDFRYLRNQNSANQTFNWRTNGSGQLGTTLTIGTGTYGGQASFFTLDDISTGTLGNSAFRYYPTAVSAANVAASFSMIPRGTGLNATYKSAFSLFNSDAIANSSAFALLSMTASGTLGYGFGSYYVGASQNYPIWIDATLGLTDHTNPVGTKQFYLNTDGKIGVHNNAPSETFDVTGTIGGTSKVIVKLDGSNTIGAGANYALSNTAATRQWARQLNASNGLDDWYYDGATWVIKANLTNGGVLSATSFSGAGTGLTGTSASLTAGLTTSLAGGSGGTIPYQSAAGTTAMLANGTAGYILQANGTTVAPSWVAPSTITAGTATNATNTAITDDNATNATMYPTWVTTTTGNLPQKVSSTGVTWNPSDQTLRPVKLETTGGITIIGSTPNLYLGRISGTAGNIPGITSFSSNGTYHWSMFTNEADGVYRWLEGGGETLKMSLTQAGSLGVTSLVLGGAITGATTIAASGATSVASLVAGAGSITSGVTLEASGSSTNLIKIQSTNTSNSKSLTFAQSGTNGAGVTGWASAGIIEGTGVGGVVMSAFDGVFAVQTGNSRVTRLSIGTGGAVTITDLATGTVQATSGVLSIISSSQYKTTNSTNPKIKSALYFIDKLETGNYYTWNKLSGLPMNVPMFGLYADNVHKVLGNEFAPVQTRFVTDTLTKITKEVPVLVNGKETYGLQDRALLALALQGLQESNRRVDSTNAVISTLKKVNKLK